MLPPHGLGHPVGDAQARLHQHRQGAEAPGGAHGRHEHDDLQQPRVVGHRVDQRQEAQLLVDGREPRREPGQHQEEVGVDDRVAEAPPGVQLHLVVPLDPVLAALVEEEAAPCAQVLGRVGGRELVRVEDEGRVEPRDDGDRQGRPRQDEPAARGGARAAHHRHHQGEEEQPHRVVVGVRGVVQVEAAHLRDPPRSGALAPAQRRLADEGPPVRREASARADVGGAAVAELVHEVVADDLGLEDEHQPGARDVHLHEARQGHAQAPLHPHLAEERQGRGDEVQDEDPREPDREHLGHDAGGAAVGALLEGPERLLAVVGQDQKPREDHHGHAPGDEGLREVVPHVRVVEGEALGQREELTKAEHLPREDLLAGAHGELGEEAQDGVEAQVPALGEVEVLLVQDLPASPAEGEVHAGEDVLREVERLGPLGDPALLHHVLLVHDVRVAVVHARAQEGPAPLLDRAEGLLGARREVADGADVARDVLREADDALGLRVPAKACTELAQDARQQHHLLEVRALVGVDALREDAAREDARVVLVVALAVSEDRVARQLDAPPRQAAAVGILAAALVGQAAEVPSPLPVVHAIRVGVDIF
mmetsp:Transcript_103052/g.222476  ORF Transcript_103052/g.222476 Transcript_103052/m.222476 type:complete len:595 (+) Transcript_103052:877-2661(+)